MIMTNQSWKGDFDMDSCRCNRGNNRGCSRRQNYRSSENTCGECRCNTTRNRDCCNITRERECCQSDEDMTKVDAISGMPIAMAYVPWQTWNCSQVLEADCGLANGTIFPELVKPFWVKCGLRG